MEIRDRIKKMLELKDWSVYKLSKESSVAQSTLSDILSGKNKNPSVETLDKLASALGIFTDRLTGEAVSTIIEERIEELGISLNEVAAKAKVPLYWLQNIDTFIPGEMDDIKEFRELDWEDTIGDYRSYKSYEWITRVANILGLSGGLLRAALARQEIPAYDGPIESIEDDFADVDFDYIDNTSIISAEATEVAHAYDEAEFDKQNIVRLTLGLDLKKESKITRIYESSDTKPYKVAESIVKEYNKDDLELNAARPLKGATEEDRKHDDDIMDDPNF